MKSTFKKLPGSVIELEVALDQKEFQSYWENAYNQAIANVQIKGFRPGTAPKELADQAVDKDRVFEKSAQEAVKISLDEISQENGWTIINAPKIELRDSELGLKYQTSLTIFPEINLGDYKKIAKKIMSERKPSKAEPEEIEKSLRWLINSRAKLTKANREIREGDLVDIDVESETDSFKSDKFVFGEGKFIPGFEEQLANLKAGDTIEFSLQTPKDYWNEKLRDKKINFKVRVNDVFNRELPKLDDSFVQGLGPAFKTVGDLRASINDGLKKEKEEKETERLRIKILEEIGRSSKMDIPEIMIAKTVERMAAEYKPAMEKLGKSEEELKKQLYDQAKNNVTANLVINKIAEEENLRPSEEEVQKELELLGSKMGKKIDIEKYYGYIYNTLLNQKVFALLEK